jgi:hypothetical protein
MKFNLFALSMFFLPYVVMAQKESTVFLGTVAIKGGKSYPYKLQFRDSANIIKGVSVTDVRGADETKTAIWGTINPGKKEIKYRETHLISTKSSFDKDSFCFISTRLRISDKKGIKLLKGNFTGYKKDGKTTCGTGTVQLLASDDLISKLMKYVDTNKTPLPATPVEKKEPVPVPEKDNYTPGQVQYVSAGKSIEIPCTSAVAVVEIWDHEKVDGDVISLSMNGKTVLDKYSLVGKPRIFNLPLSDRGTTDIIKLTASNEGSEPPATFRIKITTGERVYTVQASTTLSEGVEIALKNR